ncbi:alpha-n-acetylglucosaminidase-like protein [Trifolium pratense]|uniref:Alpha-n-acetylglucosaminidase-like protein n=1 Tax=Trifolium pratense TaxID=57577 RepID=A0A2K3NS60_TRIPR|nr:alpha-n-acetylglucosaminidase-like protein [Trifolium pratense]
MDSSSLFISLIFIFSLLISSSKPTLSSTLSVDAISRTLQIQHRERSPPAVQEAAAGSLLSRLLPSHSSSFHFRILSKNQCGGEYYCFTINNHPSFTTQGSPQIQIEGTTGVDIVAGLHWYLKHWCGSHISWDKTGGSQLFSVPNVGFLPRVHDAGISVQRPVPWNYYQNAVTSSYSFAWWDWKRWEKEIDWMALHGVNLPLAFTGQEAIWHKVFKEKFNMSISNLNDFFGGPAFLAWSRMGNLHGWGGPLPQSWFDQQLILQKKILARMYELGMTPVLPAFSGNVPAALKSIFPSAKITRLGNWFSVKNDLKWCCTYLLDATDPLFVEIGRAFVEQQLQEYGRTSHIYNCDTFDENTPPINDPEYISSLGAAIFKGMQSGDNDAVWLMQGWLFSYDPFWRPPQMKALLHSVPVGKLVVLDLFAEVKPIWATTEQFYGVPYIWKVGVGMSMEGIEQNPIVYDLMSEMAFQHKKINVKVWVDLYSTRRYGRQVPLIQEGWNVLYHTIYNCTDGAYDKNRDIIVAFPDVDPSLLSVEHKHSRPYGKPFSRAIIKEITDSFDRPHLWYDLVDLTRQVLAKYANQLFYNVIEAYQSHDVHEVALLGQKFLDLVEDLDALLACHDGFLLGPWLDSAIQLAQNEEQKRQFEWNARTQITMWFDNTDEEASLLRDYGNKYWSGLLHDYYGPRAAIYFKYLRESLEKDEDFNLKEWRREWIKLTNDWQSSRNIFPVVSRGDALSTSRRLFNKYLNLSNPKTLESWSERLSMKFQ